MTLEAYRIAVRIKLINEVSGGLAAMSRGFQGTEKDAARLQKRLDGISKAAKLSALSLGAGYEGLKLFDGLIKPAEEYTHQLSVMNLAGLKQQEIATSVAAAWKLAGENLTTTATGNLKALLDLRNILPEQGAAEIALPIISKIRTVLAASSEGRISGKSDDLAFSTAKALDIIGAATDRGTFERQAEAMTRVIQATQGRVTPAQYLNTFQYARQAKYGFSDEFKYEILPTLMLEGGGGKGSGGGGARGPGAQLAALYRVTNQGYVNKKSLPLLERLGLVAHGDSLTTSTPGTVVTRLKGADVASRNPFEWVQQYVLPAILKTFGHKLSSAQLADVIGQAFRGNQLAASLIGELALKGVNFRRDQQLIRGTLPLGQAYDAAVKNDPNMAEAAVKAQFDNLRTAFAVNVIPVLIPAMTSLAKGLNDLGAWARRNPDLAKDLVLGLGGLSAALAFSGLVWGLKGAFSALGLVIGAEGGAGALGAVGKLGAALRLLKGGALAFGGGYAAGTLLYDGAIAGTKTGDVIGRLVAGTLAAFGNKEAKDAIRRLEGIDPSIGAGAKPINITVQSILDGKKVSESVTQYQAKELSRMQAGRRTFDPNISLTPVGAR
ncbi:MAG: hypothetical protein NVS9B10_15050 [Nevskia sp.]